MGIVGIIISCFAALIAIFGVLVGVRSLPNVRRYLRMRSL